MPEIDNFYNILFELSNEDRFNILQELVYENFNVTNMAKRLSLTTQESSRHLNRLCEVGLIKKNISGDYDLTIYGVLILNQISGVMFTTTNMKYFLDHKTEDLPLEFLYQLSKLSESRLVTDVMVSFAHIDRIIDESTEYIWRLTDRYNMMSLPKLEAATERGVNLRLLQSKYFQYPPEWPGPGVVLRKARLAGRFEVRHSSEANLFIAMNEREVAILAFPMDDNLYDYRGFTSNDEEFHGWCREVFQNYWKKGKPVS
jgi:predicted transcriptional regulator